MFATVFTVIYETSIHMEREEQYTAYFEDYDEAKKFAEDQMKKASREQYEYSKTVSYCGDVTETWYTIGSWDEPEHWFWLTDDAWVHDHSVGIEFHDRQGLIWRFEDMETFRAHLKESQRCAVA